MPERHAQERLSQWREAERAEKVTEEGSVARRRAHATSRRARWAYEDATQAASEDHGAAPRTLHESMWRATTRLHEASEAAAELSRGNDTASADAEVETDEQRDRRVAEEDEIARELGEGEPGSGGEPGRT